MQPLAGLRSFQCLGRDDHPQKLDRWNKKRLEWWSELELKCMRVMHLIHIHTRDRRRRSTRQSGLDSLMYSYFLALHPWLETKADEMAARKKGATAKTQRNIHNSLNLVVHYMEYSKVFAGKEPVPWAMFLIFLPTWCWMRKEWA